MSRGVTWGDYRLLGRLAAGGMAEVFLAQRVDSPESFLAVKRMKCLNAHLQNANSMISEWGKTQDRRQDV